ncbi:mCG148360 [Mus musculus]|nr:mCG148360 [Mus musculus]
MVQEKLRVLHLHLKAASRILVSRQPRVLKPMPTVTHLLQQGHTSQKCHFLNQTYANHNTLFQRKMASALFSVAHISRQSHQTRNSRTTLTTHCPYLMCDSCFYDST